MAPDPQLPTGAVTFLFTDIEGSTEHWERDPEGMRDALVHHDRLIETTVRENGGAVIKTGGDSFNTVFADPRDALTAAIEAQRSLAEAHWETTQPITVRMGLHTGTAQLRSGDYFGPTLNRVARVMAAGHGGQILVSSATQRLVVDDLPTGVTLVSKGVHHLRGLDRPEEIFQATADGLASDFPALGAVPVGLGEAGILEAYQAKDWSRVLTMLTELEATRPLSGSEHEMLAFALWWLGKHEDLIVRFEHAYRAYEHEGDAKAAAVMAVWLAETHHHNLSADVARAWERRADRLLEGDEDSIAMGHLLRWRVVQAFEVEGDIARALDMNDRVMEIARAHTDGSLEALALQDRGRILVARGDIDEGMGLMDEAMLAAVAGDVNPVVVGRSFCNMLTVCDRTGDLRRATEWSRTAERWCNDQEAAPYPGVCRIFKAEIMWQQGDWTGAESEVMRASNELGILTDIVGEAWYQFGEMRLWAGDDEGAEEAFQEALARGRQPVPGLAHLLARRDELASAVDLLRQTLADPTLTKLDRTKFLPSLAELCLQQGDVECAEAATEQLARIQATVNSEYFEGELARCRGRIAQARGDREGAVAHFRDAVRLFSGLRLPYKTALAHADLAHAYAASDNETLAGMEYSVARSEFEKLGAEPDAKRAAAALAGLQTD